MISSSSHSEWLYYRWGPVGMINSKGLVMNVRMNCSGWCWGCGFKTGKYSQDSFHCEIGWWDWGFFCAASAQEWPLFGSSVGLWGCPTPHPFCPCAPIMFGRAASTTRPFPTQIKRWPTSPLAFLEVPQPIACCLTTPTRQMAIWRRKLDIHIHSYPTN